MKIFRFFNLISAILFFGVGGILISSCSKSGFINSADARIILTADTLKFDTVFVTAGSVTKSFKIINDNDRKLRLSSVRLMGGNTSAYRINVDGLPVTEAANIELEANDSIYVFVQVTIDPSSANLPFIIRDSVRVAFNGNEKFVQLESWGQNAHFLRDRTISGNVIWNNDLPYVIQGSLYIDEGASLTINRGTQIYVHADAPIIVDGSLITNGGKDTADRVYFSGDRLDLPYRDFPASWPGIYFTPISTNNFLQYTVIKNAYQALSVESPSLTANPKLRLNECIIDNAFDAGIYASNSSITAINSLISNCGKNIVLTGGGVYQFTHCTAVTYSTTYINHKDPVLTISNASASASGELQAAFRNCIFWGEGGLVDNEVTVQRSGSAPFFVNFDHNLWKVTAPPAGVTVNQAINGQAPLFDSINTANRYFNFRLKPGSPAIDKGTASLVSIDLDGNTRPVNLPDLGCFEHR